jgi:SAM-dependent methyltransferase
VSGRGPGRDDEPHHQRQVAESFGADSERYDRARPRYPAAMIDAILAASPGPDFLDVGTGTGIAARQLQAAGCRVLGVDVDPRMAGLARRHGLIVEVARFEAWEPVGRAFDAVVAGQAWHWVDPVAGAAKAAEVLRPGGLLAVFWNVFEPPANLRDRFSEVYRRVLPDSPAGRSGVSGLDVCAALFTKAADGMASVAGFGSPAEWRYDWAHHYARDEWLDQLPTFGGHNQLPPDKLQSLLTGIGDSIDGVGGSFRMSYRTVVVTARRSEG